MPIQYWEDAAENLQKDFQKGKKCMNLAFLLWIKYQVRRGVLCIIIIMINEYCDQFIFGLGLVLNDNLDNLVSSLDSLMTFLSFKIHG